MLLQLPGPFTALMIFLNLYIDTACWGLCPGSLLAPKGQHTGLISDKVSEQLMDKASSQQHLKTKTGVGDLSIIRAYERYRDETPAIGEIRIWSTDNHLIGYHEKMEIPSRRRR